MSEAPTAPALTVQQRVQLITIALASLALFGSLRTPDFNDFDGVNFALAVRDGYDLARHQPHPPGFPLHILAAKGLFLLTRDALNALTLLSAIGGASALAWTWWLARLWWPERPAVAWLAAGWLLVTPHFWLSAEKELSDAPTLALHIGAVACAWRGLWSWRWRAAATGLVAMGLGFRAQSAAGFVPPWVYLIAMSGGTDPRGAAPRAAAARRLAVHSVALGALCALWFIGMVQATGGWAAYRRAMSDYTAFLAENRNTLGLVGGLDPAWWAARVALHANTFLLAAFGVHLRRFTSSTALILWIPGLAAAAAVLVALWRARSARAITAALWAIPYFLSCVLLFQPTNERYALPLLPPLILFASAGVVHLRWPRAVKLALAAPFALWLVFITTGCVRTLRTELSPFAASVRWIFEGDHGPVWGSGVILVEGEARRLADYEYPVPPISGARRDLAFVGPPGAPLPPGRVLASARFTRSLLVHTKHSDLVVTLFDQPGP